MARDTSKAYETSQEVFPQRLNQLMREFGITQSVLANICGVRRQTISLYIQGQSSPDWKKLKAIADTFNVSADWLLGLSDEQKLNGDNTSCTSSGLSKNAIEKISTLTPEAMCELNACLELSNLDTYLLALSNVRRVSLLLDDCVGNYKGLSVWIKPEELKNLLASCYSSYQYNMRFAKDIFHDFVTDVIGFDSDEVAMKAKEKIFSLDLEISKSDTRATDKAENADSVENSEV